MPPPAAKRDELVTVLLEKIDRLEGAVAAVRESVVRIEANEEQARMLTAAAALRVDGIDKRLTELEKLRNQDEGMRKGAAFTGKAVWALLGAAAAGLLALANWFRRP